MNCKTTHRVEEWKRRRHKALFSSLTSTCKDSTQTHKSNTSQRVLVVVVASVHLLHTKSGGGVIIHIMKGHAKPSSDLSCQSPWTFVPSSLALTLPYTTTLDKHFLVCAHNKQTDTNTMNHSTLTMLITASVTFHLHKCRIIYWKINIQKFTKT